MLIENTNYDVIIVGAGPSGSNTARKLASAGFKVLLIDAKEKPGKNVLCGGIIGKEVISKFNIPSHLIISEFREGEIISPSGKNYLYTHPEAFAVLINRSKFDKFLYDLALSKGAKGLLNYSVISASNEKDKIEIVAIDKLTKERKKFTAKMLVIATGVNIFFNKKLKLGYPKKFLKAIQIDTPLSISKKLQIFINNKYFKGGFGWVIPLGNGFYRIGLVTEKNPWNGLKMLKEKYFPTIDIKKARVKPIAQGFVTNTFGERIIIVGESAGQIKTTTGGGIYWGLLCSEIAADVIAEAFNKNNFSKDFFSKYEKLWQDLIGNEIKTGLFIKKFFSRLSNESTEKLLYLIFSSEKLLNFIKKRAKFDWHVKILVEILKKIKIL